MKLKVFLLITPIIILIFYMIVITALKAFTICRNTEYFATDEEKQNILTSAREAQNKLITELGGSIDADDPVTDAYLPYSFNVYNKDLPTELQDNNNFEYIIISTYKKILNRNPTQTELGTNIRLFKQGEINEDLLRTYLFNSTEYAMNAKTQTNDIDADLEYSFAKQDMMAIITKLYYEELDQEAPRAMLLPLRDLFMYLENDQYLFRALLVQDNYKNFENEVINSKKLKKEDILNIFNKYFVLGDIRLKANDIKRFDALTRDPNKTASQPPANGLPANSEFQGADLDTVTSGIGAGSGAQWDPEYDNQTIVSDLLASTS